MIDTHLLQTCCAELEKQSVAPALVGGALGATLGGFAGLNRALPSAATYRIAEQRGMITPEDRKMLNRHLALGVAGRTLGGGALGAVGGHLLPHGFQAVKTHAGDLAEHLGQRAARGAMGEIPKDFAERMGADAFHGAVGAAGTHSQGLKDIAEGLGEAAAGGARKHAPGVAADAVRGASEEAGRQTKGIFHRFLFGA